MNTSLPTRLSCDLLVIGSGASGLSAAVTAAHHGLKVIVVEKDPVFGGATTWSAAGCGRWPRYRKGRKWHRGRSATIAFSVATASASPNPFRCR